MRNVHRLINDFKWQDRYSIGRHLNAMGMNYAVYSTCLKDFAPHLVGYDVYVYADDNNLVVVCLDCCGHNETQRYEEPETPQPLIYSGDCEPRTSVVWKMLETIQLLKTRLKDSYAGVKVYGVLMTEAEILNAWDMEDIWEARHLKVIDGFWKLKGRGFKVNPDDDLAAWRMVEDVVNVVPETIFDTPLSDSSELKPMDDDEEFRRLFEEMLGENPNGVNEADDADEILPEEGVDGDADAGTAVDEDDDALLADPDSSSWDGEFYPDGEIKQNNNISVKVEILRPVPNPREELDKLVGCADIKRRMDELLALTRYNKLLREYFPDRKQHEVSLHSIFFGRPGTGKTTVCRIFGSLLRQAGVLSKGHVVVCDRSTFLGTLWGDEERAVSQVVEKAQGGVLMIDEAYLLNSKHDHDPGKNVIQQLMSVLADEKQRDLAVVLCGYKEPMKNLLDLNPGLQSRFPNKFEFCDFTVDELLEITRRRLQEYDYEFTASAWEKYRLMLAQAYQVRDPETWGNARFIANQLERIYIRHATRCVQQQPADKSELLTIIPEDIIPVEVPRPKARIGF